MLPLVNPCINCLVEPLGCTRMCEDVTEYYKKRVRKRSKNEVETATGYYWEDDYQDKDGNIIPDSGKTMGRITQQSEKTKKKMDLKKKKDSKLYSFLEWMKFS